MSHQPPSVEQERAELRAWEIRLVEQQHTYLVNSLEDPQVAVDLAINQPVVITALYAALQPETPTKQPDSDSVDLVSPVPSEGPKTAPVDHTWFSQAALDVTAERRRQIASEGWTPEHDDQHGKGELALAAAAYAVASTEGRCGYLDAASKLFYHTGWAKQWWKPHSPRRDLVKAAALILAEIERLDRAEANRWKPCSHCTPPDYCTNHLRGCDIGESREAGIEPIAAAKGQQ